MEGSISLFQYSMILHRLTRVPVSHWLQPGATCEVGGLDIAHGRKGGCNVTLARANRPKNLSRSSPAKGQVAGPSHSFVHVDLCLCVKRWCRERHMCLLILDAIHVC